MFVEKIMIVGVCTDSFVKGGFRSRCCYCFFFLIETERGRYFAYVCVLKCLKSVVISIFLLLRLFKATEREDLQRVCDQGLIRISQLKSTSTMKCHIESI